MQYKRDPGHLESFGIMLVNGSFEMVQNLIYLLLSQFLASFWCVLKALTQVYREYSTDEGDPYYPVPNKRNKDLYKKYQVRQSKYF